MKYRCQYRLSDKVVLGGTANVSATEFDDASHGTTIEFTGNPPTPDEKIYDDTLGSEKLDPNPNYKVSYELTTPETDTDGDGIIDIAGDNIDTATINIQKKDKDLNDMVAAGDNDSVFVELAVGAASVASLSLVNGVGSFVLQASLNVGCVVSMAVKGPENRTGVIKIKFI